LTTGLFLMKRCDVCLISSREKAGDD
jgi:hypothetical protein